MLCDLESLKPTNHRHPSCRQVTAQFVAGVLLALWIPWASAQTVPPEPAPFVSGQESGVADLFPVDDFTSEAPSTGAAFEGMPAADDPVEELTLEERVKLLEKRLRDRDAADRAKAEAEKAKAATEKQKKAELERKKEEDDRQKDDPGNKKFVTRPFGRVHIDAAAFDQDHDNILTVGDAQNGADIRRARLGAEGEGFGRYFYRFDVDFVTFDQQTTQRPVIIDAYLDIQDVDFFGTIRAGHFREPFSLERLDSTHDLPFLERSLPVGTLAPFRNLGVMAMSHTEDSQFTWGYGVFSENTNELGEEVIDNTGISTTGRFTWNPLFDPEDDDYRMLHLGASYSFRHPSRPARRYNQTPEVILKEGQVQRTPNFVDTGIINVTDNQIVGFEALWVNGSASLQSEYIFMVGTQTNGTQFFFQGGYLEATWFLTGEHKNYSRATDNFTGVVLNSPVVISEEGGIKQVGTGAWELAARVSWIDLDDNNISGGKLTDLTLGVNWYYTLRSRVMFNYIHAFLDRKDLYSNADVFAVRFQYAF